MSVDDFVTCSSIQIDKVNSINNILLFISLPIILFINSLFFQISTVYYQVIVNSFLLPILLLHYLILRIVISRILHVEFSIRYNPSDKMLHIFHDCLDLSNLEKIYTGIVTDLEFTNEVVELASKEYRFQRIHWIQIAQELATITKFNHLELPVKETTRYEPIKRMDSSTANKLIPNRGSTNYFTIKNLVIIEFILIGVGILYYLLPFFSIKNYIYISLLEFTLLVLFLRPQGAIDYSEVVFNQNDILFRFNDFYTKRIALSDIDHYELTKYSSELESTKDFQDVILFSCILNTGDVETIVLHDEIYWKGIIGIDDYYNNTKSNLENSFRRRKDIA